MTRQICLMLCIFALTLTACGKQEEPEPATPTDSRLPDDNVFKDQVRALEKAEGVQKTLDEAEAKRREMMEGQGQ